MPRRDSNKNRHFRKREEEKKKKDTIGWMIIGSIGAAGLALAMVWHFFLSTPSVNPNTGCLVERRTPEAHTVILVDETDKLSADDLRFAKEVIENEYYWLPLYGRLTVRSILADPDAGQDIVVCRMDDGSGSFGIAVTPKKIRQDFDRAAGKRLDDLYKSLANAPLQKQSPIIEAVARAADQTNFKSDVKQRRLILISDMAQHSALFSQYGRGRLRLSASDMAEYRADLSDVEVRIHYIKRHSLQKLQTAAHRKFWSDFFEMAHTKPVLEDGHDLRKGESPDKKILIGDEGDL